ncbi:unnamed protein product [Microthlaspi erraticum]|uniref:Bulb-type lectin domain-containing protein n=1 Tax=Microthlaspi erraticum TaxID=1685480 RepID=A0A6D2HZW2_9BRAS|nr:unnamed protein product [Microthlaspi erraticum]
MMTRRVAHYYPFLIAFLMILIPPTFGLWRLSVDNETIISPGNVFELGVFRGTSSFSGSEYYYLGIWFKRFPRIIVWVANGDTPLYNSTAFLKISGSHLYLLNVTGGLVWQANATIQDPFSGESVVAELLDSGNFVVRYANNSKPDGILWQSFDYPTDTLLPGMELGLFLQGAFQRKSLTSWAGPGDPANGRFTYGVDTRKDNFLESLIYDEYYVETARLEPSYAKIFRTYSNNQRVSCSLRTSINASYYAALRLSYDGVLRWWEWSPKAREMNSLWVLPDEDCDKYNECGPNARCFMSPLKACECLEGFHMSLSDGKEMGYVQNGCLRKSQLNCSVNHVFRKLPNAKLPRIDDDNMVEMSLGLEQCQEKCLKNCSCTAFANMEIPNGGSGCVTWVGDLNDIRTYQQQLLGQDFYLKVVPTHLVG